MTDVSVLVRNIGMCMLFQRYSDGVGDLYFGDDTIVRRPRWLFVGRLTM